MYLFSIPDSVKMREFDCLFLMAMRTEPKWFFDDFIIETAYGCPASCIWNGNRTEFLGVPGKNGVRVLREELNPWSEVVKKVYTDNGIRYRLTFTNFLLEEEHLADEYGNKIATLLNETGAYVMVSTDLMADYLRKNYPKLQICWSTTTEFGEGFDKINCLSAKELTVLPYEYNNTDALDKLEHPENIEVLVNENCIDHCPRRHEHWINVNKFVLRQKIDDIQNSSLMKCFFEDKYLDKSIPRHHLIKRDKLAYYAEKGINHFKISGRVDPSQGVEAYFHYFVRPEYQQHVEDYINNRFENMNNPVEFLKNRIG